MVLILIHPDIREDTAILKIGFSENTKVIAPPVGRH